MNTTTLMYGFLGLAVLLGIGSILFARPAAAPGLPPVVDEVACTMDAQQCPDGTFVGRTGPDCEFVCPPAPAVDATVSAAIAALADRIVVVTPVPEAVVSSPLVVTGKARGSWFFEASFPVVLTDWDGKIIAEGVATATGDWMTTEFVPFTATLTFVSPYTVGAPEFMERGSLILQRDNPSGLPEHDAALEFPVRFVRVGVE